MSKPLEIRITGDSSSLQKATAQSERELAKFNQAVSRSAKHTDDFGKKTQAGLSKMQGGFGSMASTLGGATTNMGGAVQGLTGQIGGAVSMLGPWGMAIGATVGGLGVLAGGLFALGQKSTDLGVSIGRLQRLTGGTSEEMSVFAYMAQQTGVDVDGLGRSLGIFSKNLEAGKLDGYAKGIEQLGEKSEDVSTAQEELADAQQKLGDVQALQAEKLAKGHALTTQDQIRLREATENVTEAQKALTDAQSQGIANAEKFGFATRDANGNLLPTVEILGNIADRFLEMEDGPEKTALAMQIFGKSGAAMIPMLNQGREGIMAYAEEAEKFGLIMGDEQVANAKKSKAAQRDLSAAWTGLQVQLGNHVMPVLTQVTQWLADHMAPVIQAITPAIEWLKQAFSDVGGALEEGGFEKAMEKIGEKFGELWQMISPHLQRLLDAVGQWVETTGMPWLRDKFGQWAWAAVQWVVETNWQVIAQLGQWLVDLGAWIIGTGLPWVGAKFMEFAGAAQAWVTEAILNLPNRLAGLAGTIFGWIARQATEMPGRVAALAENIIGWVGTAITEAPGKLAELGGKVWEFIQELPGKLIEWTQGAGQWLWDIGVQIFEGLKNGLLDAVGRMGEWIGGLKDSFMGSFSDAFGISSPSKEMMPLGRFLAAGVGEGFQAGMADVGRYELPEVAARFSVPNLRAAAPSGQALRATPSIGGGVQVVVVAADVNMDGAKVGDVTIREIERREGAYA